MGEWANTPGNQNTHMCLDSEPQCDPGDTHAPLRMINFMVSTVTSWGGQSTSGAAAGRPAKLTLTAQAPAMIEGPW